MDGRAWFSLAATLSSMMARRFTIRAVTADGAA
jgi:hypothetical protein